MRKLFALFALVAIAGCTSPLGVEVEEADPNIAFEFECDPAETNPNSIFYCH